METVFDKPLNKQVAENTQAIANKTTFENLGQITASSDVDALKAAFEAITETGKPVTVNYFYLGQWVGIAYKYDSGPYGMMFAIQYNSGMEYVLHKTGANTYSVEKVALKKDVAPTIGRIQTVSMSYTFPVSLPRSSGWLCGLLITNTDGGGNGVYFCDLTGTTFSSTKIASNTGNNQTITGTLNGTTLTLEAKNGTQSLRFSYATWIGLM